MTLLCLAEGSCVLSSLLVEKLAVAVPASSSKLQIVGSSQKRALLLRPVGMVLLLSGAAGPQLPSGHSSTFKPRGVKVQWCSRRLYQDIKYPVFVTVALK